jgi:hypothetical protein
VKLTPKQLRALTTVVEAGPLGAMGPSAIMERSGSQSRRGTHVVLFRLERRHLIRWDGQLNGYTATESGRIAFQEANGQRPIPGATS